MVRSVTLLTCLALCLSGGRALATPNIPSITHQNPAADTHPEPLDDYLRLRDNSTTEVEVGAPPVSRADVTPWGLFGRQVELPGDGALLCPTGICADGSCCGPQGICGYGPDFCGVGCQNNCTAKAMCGQYSANGGTVKCGLDLCCSWGGWCGSTQAHCVGPDQWSLCQQGFGKCEVIRPTEYPHDSGTANGRTIGYYQSWNTRNRVCNKVWPSQIKKEQYSHLYFAFATIDPVTFQIAVAHPGDIALMSEFTALKGPGLQTWIAVGGYDFSDPGTPTHHTWSDLCATPARRAAFINSVRVDMDTYGFQGVDLDWEYPVDETRGGRPEDVVNFVSLLREMRAAYGTSYGISLTLAPDYWYLRWFDAKGLEPYVDHMGFMAYDLHGFWDADVTALGALVRGQADIREIYNNSIPLAYAELDFSKLDFGIAWYGRGYTLQDPSCNTLGCPCKGPSRPAKCTNAAGVMSLDEVQDLIAEKGLEPRLLQGSMMKELVWDDQWIGYDDEETVAMKKAFANKLGFGGTMAWSVDFYTGESGSAPVSTDGSCGPANGGTVREGSGFGDCCSVNGWCGSTPAHCGSGCQSGKCIQGAITTDGSCGAGANHAICAGWPAGECCSPAGWCGGTPDHCGVGCQSGPCTDRNDVVFLDPQVYRSSTAQCPPPCTLVLPDVILDSARTVSMPPFTTSLEVGSSVGGTFAVTTTTVTVVVQSVVFTRYAHSNVVVTNGQTSAVFNPTPSMVIPPSTITVTNGLGQTSQRLVVFPPWRTLAAGDPDEPLVSESFSSQSTWNWTSPRPPMTYTPPPDTRPASTLPCTANYGMHYIADHDVYIPVYQCEGASTVMQHDCVPTRTVRILADTTKSFALGCTLFTGTGTPTTDGPLPPFTEWPEGELVWDEDEEEGESKSSCRLWFFDTCFFGIFGWRWRFPSGVFPPVPPPGKIIWPPWIKVDVDIPGPWPPITIGWDRKPTFPVTKAGRTCTTTRTAEVCSTTTTLDITTSGTSTTITSTRTQSTCTTIRGSMLHPSLHSSSRGGLANNCRPMRAGDVIIYPSDPEDTVELMNFLMDEADRDGYILWDKSHAVMAGDDYVSFIMVKSMSRGMFDRMWNGPMARTAMKRKYNLEHLAAVVPKKKRTMANSTLVTRQPPQPPQLLHSRTDGEIMIHGQDKSNLWFNYKVHQMAGAGQVIYVVEEGIFAEHGELAGGDIDVDDSSLQRLFDFATRYSVGAAANPEHGTEVTAKLIGARLGLARQGKVVLAPVFPKQTRNYDPPEVTLKKFETDLPEALMIGIISALDHIMRAQAGDATLRGRQIINISAGDALMLGGGNEGLFHAYYHALRRLEDLGVVVVVAAHNEFRDPDVQGKVDGIFERFTNPDDPQHYIPSLIVASGIDQDTKLAPDNPYRRWMALAPAWDVEVPELYAGYQNEAGASYAAPHVAGAIAYWRSLLENDPHGAGQRRLDLREPINVKGLVMAMHRTVPPSRTHGRFVSNRGEELTDIDDRNNAEVGRPWDQRMAFLWTGQVADGNCIGSPGLPDCPDFLRRERYLNLRPFAADPAHCPDAAGPVNKRQAGSPACNLVLDDLAGRPSSTGGSDPGTTTSGIITYTPGPASPTCLSNCGTVCTGFYCEPTPSGHPPAFYDPQDPVRNPPTTVITTSRPIATPPPELPPLPPGPTCTNPAFPTTTVVCNGSGSAMACNVALTCATPSPTPTQPPPSPSPSPDDPPDLPDLPDPPATSCDRPLSTAETCYGQSPTRQACATSLWCPPPPVTPVPPPPYITGMPVAVIYSQLHGDPPKGWNGCRKLGKHHQVKGFPNGHAPPAGYGSCYKDWVDLASSNVKMGEVMDGCHEGGYTNGYRVCITSYGGNVHFNGRHQRCTSDNTLIRHCDPPGFSRCSFDEYYRVLKCDGKWWPDA
ncbi:hypothetical protein QBC34DRAFT_497070 [Podospora aff. communis PSN243]|uniref:chitinase n=1 Tax=Podospora aff. communis PSN243 TaxID=3040156 RepID=A0AAV9GDG2_9PEZI|nr:hypothetical protein QBC34DRAFT_497070 [Podospora aff. communis PSN243]